MKQLKQMMQMKRLMQLKSRLILDYVFIGIHGANLQLVEDRTCETCWTDGKNIGFNSEFFEGLTDYEALFVLVHEIMHVICGHCFRGIGKHHETWNAACDYAVNWILVQSGFSLPKGVLYDEKYAAMTAESIYYQLMADQAKKKNQQPQPQNAQSSPSKPGDGNSQSCESPESDETDETDVSDESGESGKSGHTEESDQPDGKNDQSLQSQGDNQSEDGNTPDDTHNAESTEEGGEATDTKSQNADGESSDSPTKPDQGETSDDTGHNEASDKPKKRPFGEVRQCPNPELEEEWKVTTQSAAQEAHRRGQLPGSLRRVMQDVCSPHVDWVSLTYRFVQQIAPSDYSWKRPNRNYLHQGLYAPSLCEPRLGTIVFGNDTSGSVSDFQQACCKKMLEDLMSDIQPESLIVMHCDADVQKVEEFFENDSINIDPVGGGGTDFRPVFDAIALRDEKPAGLIFLTDMEGEFPSEEPDYPVLWLSTTRNVQGPFGETVYLDLRKY